MADDRYAVISGQFSALATALRREATAAAARQAVDRSGRLELLAEEVQDVHRRFLGEQAERDG